MSTELRSYHQAQQLWVRAYSSAWRRHRMQDPSLWMQQEPEIIEKMQRDADIAAALTFRGHLIAGKEWTLTPRRETSPKGDLAVEVGTELVGNIEYFTEALFLLAGAFLSGAGIGRCHGEPRKLTIGDGRPRTWWVPIRIENLDKRMFQKISEIDPQTQQVTAHWEQWDVGPAKWEPLSRAEGRDLIRHTYIDDQASLGYGRGLREALAWWWYTKEHVLQESVQACERFAQGLLIAKVDGSQAASQEKTNAQLFADYAEMLENQRARHVLVIDTKDEVEMMPMSGEGWQLLDTLEEKLKNTIVTLILGSNLPTTANAGGSYALASVQENSREALIQFDRKTLEESVTKGLMGCLWSRNWPNLVELGIADERPTFDITQEKIEDPKAIAEVAAIAHGIGMDLASQDTYDRLGLKKPEKDEEVIAGGLPQSAPFEGLGGFNLDTPLTGRESTVPGSLEPAAGMDETQELQDTALNGAQVTAAAELIDRVVHNQMPPGTAIRMLVSMFNLPAAEAKAMVDEAVAFTPEEPKPAPVAPVANGAPPPRPATEVPTGAP